MNKIVVLIVLLLIIPNALALKIDGDEYTSGTGCIGRTGGAPGVGGCENIPGTAYSQGCSYSCTIGTISYEASTNTGAPYSITVKVVDYLENCVNPLQMSVYIDGNKIGSWTGTTDIGLTNHWAYPAFMFTAPSSSTSIMIREDNDYCCGCSRTCTFGCFSDLNMYIDDIEINEIKQARSTQAPGFDPNLITLAIILSLLILLSCYDILRRTSSKI